VTKPGPIGIGVRVNLNIKPSPFIYRLITKNAMGVNVTVTTTLQTHILRFKVCYKIHADSFGKIGVGGRPSTANTKKMLIKAPDQLRRSEVPGLISV